jgi:hypothetical protein
MADCSGGGWNRHAISASEGLMSSMKSLPTNSTSATLICGLGPMIYPREPSGLADPCGIGSQSATQTMSHAKRALDIAGSGRTSLLTFCRRRTTGIMPSILTETSGLQLNSSSRIPSTWCEEFASEQVNRIVFLPRASSVPRQLSLRRPPVTPAQGMLAAVTKVSEIQVSTIEVILFV